MASSDEEGEIVPSCVTDYHFVDHNDVLVSFDALPLQWSPSERVDHSAEGEFFLVATAEDDRFQKVYKRVMAWRFDLSFVQPEVSVLSKDTNWISLHKPRKSFEGTIRTVLVTLHWLHFLKKNPDTSARDLWNCLLKTFSAFEVEPSGKDLYVHMPFIAEAVKRDRDLAKCKNLLNLMEKPKQDADAREDEKITKKSKFIVGMDVDVDVDDENNGEHFDGDEGLYDHVCALCDNGGEILCCQGRCMRSFHATISAGDGYCVTLGYLDAQVDAIPTFLCPNCKYQQHQCFACGMLGSSDNSSGAEVFPCISATCGHFYHAKCVAKLLEPASKSQAEELQERISAGESFTCPVHKCFVCKLCEDKKVRELQFAICRRCPKAYHRKCLPRTLCFEKDYSRNIMQRAWDDLLPNRILIYCMDHEILRELETPTRDHIKFPAIRGQQNAHGFGLHSSKQRIRMSTKARTNLPKRVAKRDCGVDNCYTNQRISNRSSGPDNILLTKRNTVNRMAKSSMENIGPESRRLLSKTEGKIQMRSNFSIGPKQYPVSSKWKLDSVIERKASEEPPIKKTKGPSPSVNAEVENRILAIMKGSASSFNREEFLKRKKVPVTYEYSYQNFLETTITTGKVEGSVMAIRTAVKKLDEGCSIEDAKAVCEPEILTQIFKWKTKLHIYLAPFLHGKRYTSFGRHFTKVEKLEEVVNRLHYYVEHGDTIVDFCCGSNDFSVMMKEKLEKTGKHCCFKNFDLIMPKNDFCFEQRDWMSVKLDELPTGSQLIMGLNPPFGVKASLANKFINKALQFKPKLLILIVPEETKRLDQTGYPYDLIWEDKAILSGKSFYLPGSVDVHNKQLDDWNLKPPPLYLWSRCDWTVRHNYIAKEHGHTFQQKLLIEENGRAEENNDFYQDDSGFYVSGDICSVSNETLDDNDEDEPEECDENFEELEGRDKIEKSIQGNTEAYVPSDLFIDMEISSPTHSPPCSKALHDAFGTPETQDAEMGCQDNNSFQNGYYPANVDLPSPTPPEPDPNVIGRSYGFHSDYPYGDNYPYDLARTFSDNFRYNLGQQSHGFIGAIGNNFTLSSYSDGREAKERYDWAAQQHSYALQTNLNLLTQEFAAPNGNDSEIQHCGSSSTICVTDYSRTPMEKMEMEATALSPIPEDPSLCQNRI